MGRLKGQSVLYFSKGAIWKIKYNYAENKVLVVSFLQVTRMPLLGVHLCCAISVLAEMENRCLYGLAEVFDTSTQPIEHPKLFC